MALANRIVVRVLGVSLLGCVSGAASACATCGCTLSTDAATGYSAEAGWRIGIDYSYIDQDELRHGSGSATPAQVVDQPSDPSLGGGEIEKGTINRYLTLSISYRPNADWGFTALVPRVDRGHTTYGVRTQPYTPAATAPDQISGSYTTGLGDVKFLVNYQGFLATHNLGVIAGVKLPTGNYGGEIEDGILVGHPVLFKSGPMAGEALDSSLQAGTGSTDLIVGAYYYQPISQNFDAFANGQFQAAVAERMHSTGADYRPGNQTTLNFGLRYEAHRNWVPQLQINLLHKSADQGALADVPDTAGDVAYLSPGIGTTLFNSYQFYAFVQVPVYSHLDGYQLFPRWTASVGISKTF
ncbi:MAG: transporter [Rudaea sp.]